MDLKNWSYNPETQAFRFGLFRVRSPLLTESNSLSVPSGTEMFQFPEFPRQIDVPASGWVSPFGNPRVNAYLQLVLAYRR